MIHCIYANNSSFRKVQFDSGLNIILAERTKQSTKQDTRNGLGKTMLIELINFCLGGDNK